MLGGLPNLPRFNPNGGGKSVVVGGGGDVFFCNPFPGFPVYPNVPLPSSRPLCTLPPVHFPLLLFLLLLPLPLPLLSGNSEVRISNSRRTLLLLLPLWLVLLLLICGLFLKKIPRLTCLSQRRGLPSQESGKQARSRSLF